MTLEEVSFANFVLFYEDELRQIMNGENPREVLTTTQHRALRNRDIITYEHRGPNGYWKITPRALSVLKNNRQSS